MPDSILSIEALDQQIDLIKRLKPHLESRESAIKFCRGIIEGDTPEITQSLALMYVNQLYIMAQEDAFPKETPIDSSLVSVPDGATDKPKQQHKAGDSPLASQGANDESNRTVKSDKSPPVRNIKSPKKA